ncbi:MAG TPA: glycosyltransferase family 2 protein, partial [Geminocystis sp. M7585_C2015_104]|nr:glycosyltransferase family 2 protein [Geminocystis sp. M7585_C2015_104]
MTRGKGEKQQSYHLGVVIINYRTPQLTVDCLQSLAGEIPQLPPTMVAVVDNNSGDDSMAIIQKAIQENNWQPWIVLIPSSVNGGFSYGNNLGIKAIHAENYLLLNSDTIVRPGAIKILLSALTEYPQAGIIGPRLEELDGTPQISCFRYRNPLGELINAAQTGIITKTLSRYNVPLPVTDNPTFVQWVSFACVLVRRQVIEQIGLMDEGYFMYFEDVDYCRRAKEAGWGVLYYPHARVAHLRGRSSSVKEDIAAKRRLPPYYYASRSRYFAKFYGVFGLWWANLLWLAGRSVSLLRELVERKPTGVCEKEALDIWTNWLNPLGGRVGYR